MIAAGHGMMLWPRMSAEGKTEEEEAKADFRRNWKRVRALNASPSKKRPRWRRGQVRIETETGSPEGAVGFPVGAHLHRPDPCRLPDSRHSILPATSANAASAASIARPHAQRRPHTRNGEPHDWPDEAVRSR